MDESRALMGRVEDLGGAVAAIETGFYQQQIQESAYRYQRRVESGERVIVGVNRFTETSQREVEIMRIGAELEAAQIERLARVRASRSATEVTRTIDAVRRGAEGTDNLLPLLRDALDVHATVGEVCGALRDVFGVYHAVVAV
jgi:methylmalonyl-CoA mutase N-terminal domain/subunit